MLIAHADDRLREAGEYLALNEFMEEKIPVGAVYECQNKDIIESVSYTHLYASDGSDGQACLCGGTFIHQRL